MRRIVLGWMMRVRYPLVPVTPVSKFPGLSDCLVQVAPIQEGNIIGDSGVDKLALVSGIAKICGAKRILEIGTSSGFMARHLAMNCGLDSRVWTIDLPEEAVEATAFALDKVDRDVVRKGARGSPPAGWYTAKSPERGQIIQILTDSARYDFSVVQQPLDFAFIDGAHSYEYVVLDSVNVLLRMRPGGVVVWDDYRHYWPGLIQALGKLNSIIPINPLAGMGLAMAITPANWCTEFQRTGLESLRPVI
jgi:predicted O-methyltransferase YrrM